MKTKAIGKAVKATVDGIIFGLKRKSPQIAITLGVVGVGVGLVTACVATLKVPEIMEESKKELDAIKMKDTQENTDKEKFIVGLKTFGKLAKTYAVPVIITVTSVGAIILSHKIMASRVAALSSSYAAVSTAFKKYRNNVVERFGDEVDYQLKNNFEPKIVKQTDENGNEVEHKVYVPGDKSTELDKPFVFCIDETCGPWGPWYTDPQVTLSALKRGETLANAKLQARAAGYSASGKKKRGFLTVNEALECANLHHYKDKKGDEYGWFYYPDGNHPYGGDNFVSFGLEPSDSPDPHELEMYKHNLSDALYIRFNVDGPIKALLTDDDYKR